MKKFFLLFIILFLIGFVYSCSDKKEEYVEPNIPLIDYNTSINIDNISGRLSKISNENSFSFVFITDLHYKNNLYYQSSAYKLVSDLNNLNKKYLLSAAFLGGDNMANSYNRELLKKDTKSMVKLLRKLEMPLFLLKGNHDDNSIAGRLQNQNVSEVNGELTDPELVQLYTHGLDNLRNELYSYIDIEKFNTRLIYLNSIDVPYILDGKQIRYPGQWYYGYQQRQLMFLALDALNFSDKAHPSSWQVIILQHLTGIDGFTDGIVNNNDIFFDILDAYQCAKSYKIKRYGDFAVDLEVDYSSQGNGKILAIIQGHTHQDKSYLYKNIQIISTYNAGLLKEGELGFTLDIFTMDLKNNCLYSTRYGKGSNRSWQL